MPGFVKMATLDELPPGGSKEVEHGGRIYALFNVDGVISAIDGICPHQGGPSPTVPRRDDRRLPLARLAVRRPHRQDAAGIPGQAGGLRGEGRGPGRPDQRRVRPASPRPVSPFDRRPAVEPIAPTRPVTHFRPFRNADVPALAALWNRGVPGPAVARPLTVHEFDSCVVGGPSSTARA